MISSRRLFAEAPSLDPNIYGASTAAHSIATGNAFYQAPTANEWGNINNTTKNVITDWTNYNRDVDTKAGAARVTAGQVTSGSINANAVLAQIQLYQPAFTLAQVQQCINFVNVNSGSVPTVLSTLQTGGMLHYLNQAVTQSAKI